MWEILSVLFSALMIWWVVGPLLRLAEPDEPIVTHRYRSVRLAMIVGTVLMGGWVQYDLFANSIVRWDLLIILGAMGLTKAAVMIRLRLTR